MFFAEAKFDRDWDESTTKWRLRIGSLLREEMLEASITSASLWMLIALVAEMRKNLFTS